MGNKAEIPFSPLKEEIYFKEKTPTRQESFSNSHDTEVSNALSDYSILHDREKSGWDRLKELFAGCTAVDGIDETAAALAQIRGMVGPIAAETVFALGSPFVLAGLLGAIEEHRDARKEFKELCKKRDVSIDDMVTIAQKYNQEIPDIEKNKKNIPHKEFLEYARKTYKKLIEKNSITQQDRFNYARNLANIINVRQEYKVARLEKAGSAATVAAMAGMSAGMPAGMAAMGAEIALQAGEKSAETTATIAGTITTGIFAPSNAIMAAASLVKIFSGMKQSDILNQKMEMVGQLDGVIPEKSKELALEHIKRQKDLNNEQIISNGIMSPSQATLAGVGTAMLTGVAMTGVGLPAAVSAAAAGSVGAAAYNIRISRKQAHFEGNEERVEEGDRITFEDTSEEFFKDKKKISATEISKEMAKKFAHDIAQNDKELAKEKLKSLVSHVIFENDIWKLPLDKKKNKLEEIIKTGEKSFTKGTNIPASTLEQIGKLYEENKEYYEKILKSENQGNAAEKLMGKKPDGILSDIIELGVKDILTERLAKKVEKLPQYKNSNKLFKKEGGKITGFHLGECINQMEKGQQLKRDFYEVACRLLIKYRKNAAKIHKGDALENLVLTANLIKFQNNIAKETEGEITKPQYSEQPATIKIEDQMTAKIDTTPTYNAPEEKKWQSYVQERGNYAAPPAYNDINTGVEESPANYTIAASYNPESSISKQSFQAKLSLLTSLLTDSNTTHKTICDAEIPDKHVIEENNIKSIRPDSKNELKEHLFDDIERNSTKYQNIGYENGVYIFKHPDKDDIIHCSMQNGRWHYSPQSPDSDFMILDKKNSSISIASGNDIKHYGNVNYEVSYSKSFSMQTGADITGNMMLNRLGGNAQTMGMAR